MSEQEQRQGNGSGREIVMLVGVLMLVAVGTLTTYWVRSRSAEAAGENAPTVTTAVVAERPLRVSAPTPIPADTLHADVYFDFKSVRLRADAVRTLQATAEGLDPASTWGVLVQGYADHQGSADYNRLLALRRAETVKQFLVELGVPERAVKVATVGSEGLLCEEATRECQQLNRRVHLEVRKLGAAQAQ